MIHLRRTSDGFDVEVTPPHGGPWSSPIPLTASEVLATLAQLGCHSTDVTDALSDADPDWTRDHDAEVHRRRSGIVSVEVELPDAPDDDDDFRPPSYDPTSGLVAEEIDEREHHWEWAYAQYCVYLYHPSTRSSSGFDHSVHLLSNVTDVTEVIEWAERRAALDGGLYSVAVVGDQRTGSDDAGLIWLIGGDDAYSSSMSQLERLRLQRMEARRGRSDSPRSAAPR